MGTMVGRVLEMATGMKMPDSGDVPRIYNPRVKNSTVTNNKETMSLLINRLNSRLGIKQTPEEIDDDINRTVIDNSDGNMDPNSEKSFITHGKLFSDANELIRKMIDNHEFHHLGPGGLACGPFRGKHGRDYAGLSASNFDAIKLPKKLRDKVAYAEFNADMGMLRDLYNQGVSINKDQYKEFLDYLNTKYDGSNLHSIARNYTLNNFDRLKNMNFKVTEEFINKLSEYIKEKNV
jgi:hypothetical protein